MKPTDPPRPTGTLGMFDSAEGWLMLSHGVAGELGTPEPLQILGGPLAVAVFSTLETLERFRVQFPELLTPCASEGAGGPELAASTGRIVKITDSKLFFEDIPPGVAVALDVRKTDHGTVRYFDVTPMREVC